MQKRAHSLVILYRKDGKFLLQQRTEDAPHHAGYWGCFGGGMEEGETPEQTLARELVEEIEYKVRDPRPMFTQEYCNGGVHVTSHAFFEKYDETQPIVLHEGQGFGWFTLEELFSLKLSDRRRETFRKVELVLRDFI